MTEPLRQLYKICNGSFGLRSYYVRLLRYNYPSDYSVFIYAGVPLPAELPSQTGIQHRRSVNFNWQHNIYRRYSHYSARNGLYRNCRRAGVPCLMLQAPYKYKNCFHPRGYQFFHFVRHNFIFCIRRNFYRARQLYPLGLNL